ncbi:hypothetical protein CHU95_18115 [Niveispirillum lacus]|uniref:Uncharacterized protein n=1 Tax=Niveispirillum lacus TaxID=1981099 RepID=A0A255YU16_9PROT|nr:hypothetical protein [Niveispirillum lacus]OYQ32681.1 hypothetical protein CHU95_18115 [Niveispirillum lacus]
MISLNAGSLFGATNAVAMKTAIDRHVDKAVEERFKKVDGPGYQGQIQQDVYKRLSDLGIGGGGFEEAAKSAARIDELSKYMDKARSEIDRKAAGEKLNQSKRRMSELEQEARQAAARGDARKLAQIAREATGMTRNLAQEAKNLVDGRSVDPAERAAAIARGEPDPAIPVEPQPGMTAAGIPVSYARAYVQEVRDFAGRARTLLTQAEANKGNTLWMSEEEKQDLAETLKAARDDLAAAGEMLERLNGTLEALDPGGAAAAGGIDAGSVMEVTSTSIYTETLTIAVQTTESFVSITA